MLLVRSATHADLDEIARMARAAHAALHSLPDDRDALAMRIAASEASFAADVARAADESYLFVLEDSDTGRLLGTSSVVAAAGYTEPFYAFRKDALIHASRELDVNRKIHVLSMSHELTGMSRLAGFYVDPSLPDGAGARLISRARMMYVAMNRRRFAANLFSLLPGVTDDAGIAPFWEAVGRKFFGRELGEIERASGGRSHTFIAEMMPAYPLYVPLLPASAQRVIGEHDARASLAYRMLREEGFAPDRYVDIFDAGPVLTAPVARTTSVAQSETRIVRAAHEWRERRNGARAPDYAAWLIASSGGSGAPSRFRCVIADLPLARPSSTPRDEPRANASFEASPKASLHGAPNASPDAPLDAPLDAATRAALGVHDGDAVHCVRLHRDDAARAPAQAEPGAPR